MQGFRQRLGDIIFEVDSPAAKRFDVFLLWAILLSVLLVMLESVSSIRLRYGTLLRALEWGFTILFTLEYFARVYTAYDRKTYITSFFGVIDLLAVLPTYLSLFVVGSQYLIVVRALRLLRVFRVLKLMRFLGEASVLAKAVRASMRKITVFMLTILTLVVIIGSVMFLIEGPEHGFINIPISIYWAIVTLTTVGYGDIAPQTPLGQLLSAAVMMMGFAILAVPTGIVTAELSRVEQQDNQTCRHCGHERHDDDALHCKICGESLREKPVKSLRQDI